MSKVDYDAAGNAYRQIDNAGRITQTNRDMLGRTTATIENYVDGSVSETEASDADRTTQYVYDSQGRLSIQRALNPKGSGNGVEQQDTRYLYESTINGSLQTNVIYPDSSDTDSTGSDQVKFSYDWLGRKLTSTDQRGVVHSYSYDAVGRMRADVVTSLGRAEENVDGSVRRIEYVYQDDGKLSTVTTYNATTGGSIVNQIKYTYDGWGDVKSEQSHSGAVTTGTPAVTYSYEDGADVDGNALYHRLKKMTYPSGREIYYIYEAPPVGRLIFVSDNAGGTQALVQYSYLGLNTVVSTTRPGVSGGLTQSFGADGEYAGWDRFDRIVGKAWTNADASHSFSDVEYGYDRSSNRIYADNQVYGSASQYYQYDGLNRLRDFQQGKIKSDDSGIESWWKTSGQNWNFDALGNALDVDSTRSANTVVNTYNAANEQQQRRSSGTTSYATMNDSFSSDTSANWQHDSGDQFTISGGWMTVTQIGQDQGEGQAQAILLYGEAVDDPTCVRTWLRFAPGTATGEAGIIFGYKSKDDYWLKVEDIGLQKGRMYHVVNGVRTLIREQSRTLTAGTTYVCDFPGSVGSVWSANLPGGYPSGRYGLYSSVSGVEFDSLEIFYDSDPTTRMDRWTGPNTHIINANGLEMGADYHNGNSASLLEGVELSSFEATFALRRVAHVNTSSCTLKFMFNSVDYDERDVLYLYHADTPAAPLGSTSSGGTDVFNGIIGTTNVSAIPSVGQNDILWFRITNTGSRVSVKCLKNNTGSPSEADWSSAAECYYTTSFNNHGGRIGFGGSGSWPAVDDFTLKTDQNADGVFETTEYATTFTLTNGYSTDTMEYDSGGNMTYDGRYIYRYDGWNRLMGVSRGYRSDDGVLHEGSVIDCFAYDGEGRRISKTITMGTYLDGVEHYYYDYQRQIEVQDGQGHTLRQQIWSGAGYIDELVTISVNTSPAQDNTCELQYWVTQDANWNVTGVVDVAGTLLERYEYTPYGIRTVYYSPGSNDTMLMGSTLKSRRVNGLSFGLCAFGHQGLYTDEELGLIYNRARYLDPKMQRFLQRDPILYVDGMSLYQYVRGGPCGFVDPFGTDGFSNGAKTGITVHQKPVTLRLWPPGLQDMGHRWFEFGGKGDSLGFYPDPNGFGGIVSPIAVKGRIISPDPHEGERSGAGGGQDWDTSRSDYIIDLPFGYGGIFSLSMMYPPGVYSPTSKGVCVGSCHDKSLEDIKNCIRKWADYYEKYIWYGVAGPNCRTFVDQALSNCCLKLVEG